jgi:hypothetical protein
MFQQDSDSTSQNQGFPAGVEPSLGKAFDNQDLLGTALDYAADGDAVFPCRPGAKEPACPNGFKEATDDRATIEQWWRENPNYNIGMVPARNDWIVLDLDLYKGVDSDLIAQLPRTLTVRTPSGGKHLRYRTTEKFGNCRLAKNVDVRSSAGYVLVPPSVVDGKAYRVEIDMEPAPLPQWVADRLCAAAERQRERKEQTWNEGNDNPANVERARQRLQSDCEHKPGFEIACILRRDLGLSGYKATELWQEWQTEIAWQWDDDDIERNLTNAGRYGQNEPGLHAVERTCAEVFGSAVAALGTEEKRTAATGVPPHGNRFGGRLPSEDENLAPIVFIDNEQTLPRVPGDGCVGMNVGDTGAHKTGLQIKHGLDAIERHGDRVLYIAAEGAYGLRRSRLPAARKARGMSADKLDKHWRTETASFDLLSTEDHAALIEAYRAFAPTLIFIDVLTRVIGEDINAPKTGAQVIQYAEALAQAFGATVVITHHPSRQGLSKGGSGSRLLSQLADFVWHMSRAEGDTTRVWVEKMKDGRDQFDVLYKIGGSTLDAYRDVPVIEDLTVSEVTEIRRKQQPTIEELKREHFHDDVVEVLRERGQM